MARKAARKTASKPGRKRAKRSGRRSLTWWIRRAVATTLLLACALIVVPAVIAPPTTPYIVKEGLRLGNVDRTWVNMGAVAPVMARSAVAAEDANYCLHWGFDMGAIRQALDEGANRGASTISQQTVKNVYLWQERSWFRKALEAALTPLVELVWSKRRILEIYLNVAEFDEGVFGVEAA
ncbi:MAG: transglycosylase domain-containing protein, partial [Pseudomonadota bacterium]